LTQKCKSKESILLQKKTTKEQPEKSEWVSDCWSMPTQHFSAISWWEKINFQWDDDEVRFVLDQHAWLDLNSARSLKQQSAGRHVAPLGHIILILSQPVFALSP